VSGFCPHLGMSGPGLRRPGACTFPGAAPARPLVFIEAEGRGIGVAGRMLRPVARPPLEEILYTSTFASGAPGQGQPRAPAPMASDVHSGRPEPVVRA
jgi:hypothetical protein